MVSVRRTWEAEIYTFKGACLQKQVLRKSGKPRSSTGIYMHTVSMVLPVLLSTEGRSQYIVSKGAPCWHNARANTAMHMYLT